MSYWVFQSNPLKFPIIDEIRDRFSSRQLPPPYERVSYWHVKRIPMEMRRGDTVFIWKSNGREPGTRGIYAKATILSLPPHMEPLTPDSIDSALKRNGSYLDWISPEKEEDSEEWPTVVIRYTESLLHRPLKATDMKRVPELMSMPILDVFRQTLYGPTDKEGEAIDLEIARAKRLLKQSANTAATKPSFTFSCQQVFFPVVLLLPELSSILATLPITVHLFPNSKTESLHLTSSTKAT